MKEVAESHSSPYARAFALGVLSEWRDPAAPELARRAKAGERPPVDGSATTQRLERIEERLARIEKLMAELVESIR